ncbi:MAG TPA: PaaI family thioesterase [Actinomycetota bacterium]|nr:PaaI family thioesterase [Actinomycetota bacterium]
MNPEEPIRGSFAYLEQPWLFSLPPTDQLQLFIDRRLPAPPLTHLSGLVVEDVADGATTWSIPASPWWRTSAGVFAGGTLAFVADAALAGAVFTTLSSGTMLASSDLSMNFLEPAWPSSERLVAKGTVIDVGRRQVSLRLEWRTHEGRSSRTRRPDACFSRFRSSHRSLPRSFRRSRPPRRRHPTRT